MKKLGVSIAMCWGAYFGSAMASDLDKVDITTHAAALEVTPNGVKWRQFATPKGICAPGDHEQMASLYPEKSWWLAYCNGQRNLVFAPEGKSPTIVALTKPPKDSLRFLGDFGDDLITSDFSVASARSNGTIKWRSLVSQDATPNLARVGAAIAYKKPASRAAQRTTELLFFPVDHSANARSSGGYLVDSFGAMQRIYEIEQHSRLPWRAPHYVKDIAVSEDGNLIAVALDQNYRGITLLGLQIFKRSHIAPVYVEWVKPGGTVSMLQVALTQDSAVLGWVLDRTHLRQKTAKLTKLALARQSSEDAISTQVQTEKN